VLTSEDGKDMCQCHRSNTESTLTRSVHNVRIERLWRDLRKDSFEGFRQVFMFLEDNELLDMDNSIHRICLFLVFHNRIQASLDRAREAWNHHKIRTACNKTPTAIYELSRETAMVRGYWTGDPGDAVEDAADPLYGYDGEAPQPPANETYDDSEFSHQAVGLEAEKKAGITVNGDDELDEVRHKLEGFDFDEDDGNWGISVYCRAVILLQAQL
jgi:hypothetical protein